MANLNQENRQKFESLFQMDSGYVMDFSNRSFKDFVYKAIDVNAFDDKYMGASGSKANRLRKLWEVESNSLVARLNLKLLEYWNSHNSNVGFELKDLYTECVKICELLKQDSPELNPPESETPKPETPKPETPKPETPKHETPESVSPAKDSPARDFPQPDSQRRESMKKAPPVRRDSHVESTKTTKPIIDDKAFQNLAELIQDSFKNKEPQKALDQLHSFVSKYIHSLCVKHKISYDENEPLIVFYGEYVKHLRAENKINSEMTDRILSSSISVLEVFNKEWNSQSLTQKKLILNYDESMLILKSIAGIVDFFESIENG